MSIENIQDHVRDLEEENPNFAKAREKTEGIIERARLNEAIRVIDELLGEVETMPIAERFSRTRKIEENLLRGSAMLPEYESMTESDFKRTQLARDLRGIKTEISKAVSDLEVVVMDMEATKID
jgi:hypothetical protein